MRRGRITAAGVMCVTAALGFSITAGYGQAEADSYKPVEPTQAPAVFVDDDGDLIQLAPYDDATDAVWYQQENFKSFNVSYLHADQRGCKSCHTDLRQLMADSDYLHPSWNGLDVEWTVQTCRGCHDTGGYLGDFTEDNLFGEIIHGTHMNVAECWNCHAMSSNNLIYDREDGGRFLLWDDAAPDILRGFSDLPSDALPDSSFSYSQDYVMTQEDLPDQGAQYYTNDYLRYEYTRDNVPLDEEMYDNWTITVSGQVENETTFNLKELIEDPDVPKVTAVGKWHCVMNAFGGSVVGQIEMTGIPYSYLFEQCGGLTEDALGVMNTGSDGFSDGASVSMDEVLDGNAMVVFAMNGEPLLWKNGYPACGYIGGVGCGCYAKQLSDIVVTGSEDTKYWKGAYGRLASNEPDETNRYNSPTIGIVGVKNGQVFQTGETISLFGYADAFEKTISAIEISMDRGRTWKTFDIGETDVERLLTWQYDLTLEEEGSYYIMMRAVASDGDAGELTYNTMIHACDNPDALLDVE